MPKEHSWQGPSRTTQKIVAAKGNEYQHRQLGRWVRSKAKSTTAVTSSRHDIHALEEADEGEDGDQAEERSKVGGLPDQADRAAVTINQADRAEVGSTERTVRKWRA